LLEFDLDEITGHYKKVLKTSSSAIAERSRCRVGQLWPKVEDWNWDNNNNNNADNF